MLELVGMGAVMAMVVLGGTTCWAQVTGLGLVVTVKLVSPE